MYRSFLVTAVALAMAARAFADSTLTTLVTFHGPDGQIPDGSLIADASGNLYGTTSYGGVTGAPGYGTVFEVAAGTRALTTLAIFNDANGAEPTSGLLADASGNLYGTTSRGGPTEGGTVFMLAAGTHALSTVATFNGANGLGPSGGLTADASGNLYGVTSAGGPLQDGTVFRIAAGTHVLSTIATFNGMNGSTPSGGVIADASGNLYGTTTGNGFDNHGTVFKIAAGTHTLSTLATFDGANGADPQSGVIADASGNLYGTTYGAFGLGEGTVFKVAAGTNTLTTLATFTGANGSNPQAGLIADANGNFYGTTTNGGANSYGNVFRLDAATHTLTTLASFSVTSPATGRYPDASLIADADGNLYGTASGGGETYGGSSVGDGTVFELSNTGFVVPEPASVAPVVLCTPALIARRRNPSRFQTRRERNIAWKRLPQSRRSPGRLRLSRSARSWSSSAFPTARATSRSTMRSFTTAAT